MRFFTDQDVYEPTVKWLVALGHDVLRAREVNLSRAADQKLLRHAYEIGRIFITCDKGFGQLVFLSQQPHSGVILLRVKPTTLNAVHQELERFLREHADQDLSGCFVVIEPAGHRIRKSS
ncbi:MAG: DUF5615 family PIN-like protein [Acidobacteria bacterium]|nr:DUF5615 family PIN-like protein [Acidobacteriota bacterium]